ncbi:hypothetical protein KSP39_PZI002238 [Platanthera zijinensis]|uniref:Isopenicillin N synthase-like Fe(2+) 2OG dioxygenase domain-containing protein n=1 Tax=Platanthera zijinensis TaxID=2320716 RepID=A0AAP0BYE0_9ASPA
MESSSFCAFCGSPDHFYSEFLLGTPPSFDFKFSGAGQSGQFDPYSDFYPTWEMGNPSYFSYDFTPQNAVPPNFNSTENEYLELKTSIDNINSHFKTIMNYFSREAAYFFSPSSLSPPISLCNVLPDIPACLFPLEEDNSLDIPDCFLSLLEDTSMDILACFLPVEDDDTSPISPSEDVCDSISISNSTFRGRAGDEFFLLLTFRTFVWWRRDLALPQHVSHLGSEDIIVEYNNNMKVLAQRLLSKIYESLNLPHSYIEDAVGEVYQNITISYYSPCPQPELALGLQSHFDMGVISLLLQDDVGGLEVLKDGEWILANLHLMLSLSFWPIKPSKRKCSADCLPIFRTLATIFVTQIPISGDWAFITAKT